MKITWFGMESQVNSVSVVTDDVFGPRILTISSPYQLLQSSRFHENELVYTSLEFIKSSH